MAGQVSGVDGSYAAYDQTVYDAVPGTPDGREICFTEMNLQPNEELIQDPSICTGSSRGVQRPGRAGLAPAGNINLIVAPENFGYWLRHMLGAPVPTGTGPYTHTYDIDSLPVAFLIEQDFESKVADLVLQYVGCRISEATIQVDSRGWVTCNMNILAHDQLLATEPLDASLTALPGHTGFTVEHASVEIDDVVNCQVRNFTMVINNNLEEDNYTICSGGKRGGAGEGECAVTGTMELVFEDKDLIEASINGTAKKIELILTQSASASLSFTMNQVDITRMGPNINTKKGLVLSVNYAAFASGADLGLTAVLINSNPSE